jgi:hypothetical protein
MSNNTNNTPGRPAQTSPTWTRADGKSKILFPDPYSNRVRRAPEGQYGPTRLEPGEPVWSTRVILPFSNGRYPIPFDQPDPSLMPRAQRATQRSAKVKSPNAGYDFTPTQDDFPTFIPRAGPVPFQDLANGYTPAPTHIGPPLGQSQAAVGGQEPGPVFQNPWNCPPPEPTSMPPQAPTHLPPPQQYQHVVPTPHAAAQMPGFNMGREIGRLEAEAENNHKKYLDAEERGNFYREDVQRLRGQRDTLREELQKVQQELQELQYHCFNEHERPDSRQSNTGRERGMASLSSVDDSPNAPFESASAMVVAAGTINRASNNNSAAHSIASSTHSLVRVHGADPVPAGRTSYTVPAEFPISDLVIYLRKLFTGTENWGGQFATLPMSTLATNNEVQNILNTLVRICQDRIVDDLIERMSNRSYACAAIIADAVMDIMGPNVMNGFSTEFSAELESIKADLIRTRIGNAANHHAVLERRAKLFLCMQKSSEFIKFREEKIGKTCVKLCKLLSPMVPPDNQHPAILDLRRLVREAYAIGLRMATLPREWLVQQAERNERWMPESMQQRDPALVNNPKLTNSNGYGFVVRFGVHPSVIEKDYSSGSMMPHIHIRKVVMLMDNPAAKLTSDSGRR